MKRKLVSQAGQAITITLPIDWIRQNKLKPGDEIDVEEAENKLILNSGKKISFGKISFDVSSFHKRMQYFYTNAAYAAGFDEVNISGKDSYPDLSQNLGFAVISQKETNYVIKDMGGINHEDLDGVFKRVFQMIIQFLDKAIEDVFERKEANLDHIRTMDSEVNKFALFLQRAIMKTNYSGSISGKVIFSYANSLEQIGDDVLRLWYTAREHKISQNKEIKDFVLIARDSIQKAFEIYYQYNENKVKEMYKCKQAMKKSELSVFSYDAPTSLFCCFVKNIINSCYDLTHLSLMLQFQKK